MSGGGKTIVTVDDQPENRLIIKSILERHGYTVLSAKDGMECLSILVRVVPKLLLLDIQMPDMDGFALCRRIRLNDELRQVPIVFLTACETMEEVKEGMAAGGNDFLLKPVQELPLIKRVSHWCSHSVPNNFKNPLEGVR